jgi:thiol-disulfide isomerase/thioredoxin
VGGGTARLTDDRGKVVVLNVWASWCGPCREEAPRLAAATDLLPRAAFLGINTRDNEGNAEAFEQSQRIPYPSFSDQDGSLVLDMQQVVDMRSLPVTVVLDKRGRVAAAVYGPTTAITLKEIVSPLERES